MPSLGDSAFIFLLALLLFGPKKLPELARQLGKLMAEFRRASNEFKMQMEEELRMAEQAEQQKKIAAMEAAAPAAPALTEGTVTENTIAAPVNDAPEALPSGTEPLPIATSGELNMMPPSTGLPVANDSVAHAFDSVPHVADPDLPPAAAVSESTLAHETAVFDRSEGHTPDAPDHFPNEAPIHG
ncbi:twin-arginine translocase TatA/TatE family subunit [Edaphobacter bradus]|uniref:twin-arginine translocase TatA/TatE family subunit n=1 Tax=Edaphobacter bradus TaxID=2259016 RepID=UPI0021DFBA35|nr:twin-arginine translocase TatA/TatE family subunit [Edaphobacter bradus]